MNETMRWLYARTIFYPTLGWNMLLGRYLKVRNWYDFISPKVIVGAFPFASDVKELHQLGVRAVVNTCEEYEGPKAQYDQFQIEQFRMPTIDFTHPSFQDVCRAVEFIEQHATKGHVTYVHCKAGRARSATVAICWLMKTEQISAAAAQRWLLEKRAHINPRLTSRPVVQQFEQAFVNSSEQAP